MPPLQPSIHENTQNKILSLALFVHVCVSYSIGILLIAVTWEGSLMDNSKKWRKHDRETSQNTHSELLLLLLTAIGLSAGGSGYFTCIQNMKLVTNKLINEWTG